MRWHRAQPRKALRGAVCAGAIALCATAAVPAGDSQSLTLDQARAIAAQALRAGEFDVARELAMGLLKADAEDPYAYAILTTAHARLNNPDLARHAARLSYKYSETPEQSYSAARKAGQVAFQQKRYTAAQIWLRRASFYAPDERFEQQLGRDYAQVRNANPLNMRFGLSLAPSDNVNNGSDAVLDIIDGVPQGGTIGAGSRALSGTVGTGDVSLSYRLKQTSRTRTALNARMFTRRVALSSDARASAPAISNSDLGSTYAAVGLNHSFALKRKGNFASVDGTAGKAWAAGTAQYVFARAGFSPSFRLSETNRLRLSGTFEQRWSEIRPTNDTTITSASATLRHKLDGGNTISFGLNLRDVSSDAVNASYTSGVLNMNYAFGKQIGPVKLSAGLSVGYTDYSSFRGSSTPSGGRQDTSVYGDLTMVFNDYDIAGFAPSVRIRSGRKSSNFSRFDTREFTVSLGIQSKF